MNESQATRRDVDAWCDSLCQRAEETAFSAEQPEDMGLRPPLKVCSGPGTRYVRFRAEGLPVFYGYWQPAVAGPAPLLIHLPGYAAGMTEHPELVAAGFNVLHVNPLGYMTPGGPDETKRRDGKWPVLAETMRTLGQRGYVDWLACVLVAVRWAQQEPSVLADRIGTFGSSQGGGGALLTASLLRGRGIRAVAADMPFLTDFSGMADRPEKGAYAAVFQALEQSTPHRRSAIWRALSTIDTVNHAHRFDLPVMLTAGSLDCTTPPHSVETLYAALSSTRCYTLLDGQGHGGGVQFLRMARAWLGLYV